MYFFQILWKSIIIGVIFSGYFFISFEKITFYTEILSCKDDFFFFSLVYLMTKDQKTKFHAKISVWNYIFDSR